jgi:hypothetical protein
MLSTTNKHIGILLPVLTSVEYKYIFLINHMNI